MEAEKKKIAPKNVFVNLKAEFKKIIWPDQKTLVRRTIAVIACTVSLGLLIALIDMVVKMLLGLIL